MKRWFFLMLVAALFISCRQDTPVVGRVERMMIEPWGRGGNIVKYAISFEQNGRKDSTYFIGNNIYEKDTYTPFYFQEGDSLIIKLSRIRGIYHFNSFVRIHSLVQRKPKNKPVMKSSSETD